MDVVVAGVPKLLDNRTTGVWMLHANGWHLVAFHSTPLR
jgi:hypothetical protein